LNLRQTREADGLHPRQSPVSGGCAVLLQLPACPKEK